LGNKKWGKLQEIQRVVFGGKRKGPNSSNYEEKK
jgi:hypothetical protein